MKLWKRDTQAWMVREVEGEPWPGKDSEGDTCYVNTHFDNEPAAWASLEAEAKAWLSLATSGLKQAREDVARRENECAEAALALAGVMKDMPSNAPHEGPGAASSRTVPLDAVVGAHGTMEE